MFSYAKEVSEYLQKIQQGDKSQYEPLYKKTAMHLYGIAQAYLKIKSLAEDVVSEAFLKIQLYINSYDCTKDGYNWMYQIVKNIAFTYNADEKKIAKSERDYATERQLTVEDNCFNEVEFFMLIEPLGDMDREIAIARFSCGYTLEEIGKRYNVSRVAIFQRVQKICKIIEKNYKKK